MSEVTNVTTEQQPVLPPSEWADAIAASTEAQKPDPLPFDTVEEVLTVKVTAVAKMKIADELAADDAEKKRLECELDALKEDVKAKKAEVDVVTKRMDERYEAIRNGVQKLKGEWRVVEHVETNTVRYHDIETGELMHERAMTADERQQELFSTDYSAAERGEADDASEPTGKADGDEDAVSEPLDSTTNLTGDPDDTEIDAVELLETLETATPSGGSEAPTNPSRKKRK